MAGGGSKFSNDLDDDIPFQAGHRATVAVSQSGGKDCCLALHRARAAGLDVRHLLRRYDRAFLADLPPTVDACGENGQFHTFVLDGPPFRAPVPVTVASVDSRTIPFGGQDCIDHFARLALESGSA